MLEERGMRDLLQGALRHVDADVDEAEVIARSQDGALTRYANNEIHQNVRDADVEVTIRTVVGRQTGLAVTNDTSDDGVRRVAGQALAHTRANPENPDFPGLAAPDVGEAANVAAFDEPTADCPPPRRAEGVATVCRLAQERGLSAYGAFRTGTVETGYANTHGLERYHPQTYTDIQAVAAGEDGSGRAQATDWQVDSLEVATIGREAVEKAGKVQNPQAVDPGTYPVVLDPYATNDILSMLNLGGMGAQAVQEGRSWMNDRIGTEAMSPRVAIRDDGTDPAGLPLPFDFEGTPRQPVPIVEAGTVCGPVYDRTAALKDGATSTGHALPPELRTIGPLAGHLVLEPGDSTVEAMIESVDEGLYITRFWYTRLVHPRDCVVTGMTRDGVVKIENGKLTHPVKNLRFTQSYVDALNRVQAIGADPRPLMNPFLGGANRVPAVLIDGFRFTGRTV